MNHEESSFKGLKDFTIYYQRWLPEGCSALLLQLPEALVHVRVQVTLALAELLQLVILHLYLPLQLPHLVLQLLDLLQHVQQAAAVQQAFQPVQPLRHGLLGFVLGGGRQRSQATQAERGYDNDISE